MREVTTAPTTEDVIIRALVRARMDDGRPISTAVKVETILDQFGLSGIPRDLKGLIALGIDRKMRLSGRRVRGVADV